MDTPLIAVDTREQRPYEFPESRVVTLSTGDYSIVGLEDQVAIERKTIGDAYASLGAHRDRFRAAVERLGLLRYGAIVIETSLPDFLRQPMFSRMSSRAAINTLLSWSVRYGVHVYFVGDRRHGNALTRVLLEKYWKHHGSKSHAGV